MRLSLMKAAHAVTDKATDRKSGYLARSWRDVGFRGAPFDSLCFCYCVGEFVCALLGKQWKQIIILLGSPDFLSRLVAQPTRGI
jgi:hypothetical protein